MKILVPVSSPFDLGVSAVAALILHGVFLGFGFGPLERAPIPEIDQTVRCETVSLLKTRHRIREPIREPTRERVEKEREKSVPEPEHLSRVLKPQPSRTLAVEARPVETVRRSARKAPRREWKELHPREKAPEPEERTPKPPEPAGVKDAAISRAAAPAVEKGFAFVYPRFARLHGYEGRVTLSVTVSPEGRVIEVDLLKSCGYDILDQSAMRQMRSVPFLPALDREGHPVESTVIQSVNFNIKESASGSLSG